MASPEGAANALLSAQPGAAAADPGAAAGDAAAGAAAPGANAQERLGTVALGPSTDPGGEAANAAAKLLAEDPAAAAGASHGAGPEQTATGGQEPAAAGSAADDPYQGAGGALGGATVGAEPGAAAWLARLAGLALVGGGSFAVWRRLTGKVTVQDYEYEVVPMSEWAPGYDETGHAPDGCGYESP